MSDSSKIKKIVESVLADKFDGIEIVAINVKADIDEDGDDVITINVVFDGTKKRLDSGKTSSLVRRVRPKFAEIGETAFPVFSFIAKSELGRRSPEAA